MISCVMFDLDGTLCDTLRDLAEATNYALRQAGYPEHPLEKYKQMVGNGITKLIERALPQQLPAAAPPCWPIIRRIFWIIPALIQAWKR